MLPPNQTIQARYRLVFSNQVKSPAFTSNPVDPIEVAIYDTCTKSNISSECFLSSAKVRLTVLSAELWENKGENWSRSEFNQRVLRARKGKAPILTGGSLAIRLKNGLGTFGNIIFTDNSSWSNGKFRLGVMVEGKGEEGFLNGERVREGVSEPFQVKDRRVKESQKPDQLELIHNVQSIRKVGKGRAALLQNNGIKTVENLLWWYYNNRSELRKILGIKSESDQGWKSMIEHAKKCAIEFHAKYNAFKESMSNSDYVGPLSPRKKKKIKFILKFIIFLAGFKKRARMVPPAQYQPLESTSQPQQDLVHLNGGPRVVGSGSSERNPFENDIIEGDILPWYMQIIGEHISTASCEHIGETQHPLFHETNASPLDEALTWMNTLQDQFFNLSEAVVHPMGRNMSLYTNDGPRVVGSGSSEPNPFENDIMKGDMPTIYRQLSAICVIPPLSPTASGEHPVETQCTVFDDRNHTAIERVNIVNVNSMQCTTGDGWAQLEIPDDEVSMDDILAVTDNIFQGPSRSDSFNPSLCEALVQGFLASMSNSVYYVEPQTPRGKRKIKALLRSVAFLAVPRKRARIALPANQKTMLAY